VRREDGSWLLDGMMPLDEVEALTNLKNLRGEGDFHTLAGFVVDKLGRILGGRRLFPLGRRALRSRRYGRSPRR